MTSNWKKKAWSPLFSHLVLLVAFGMCMGMPAISSAGSYLNSAHGDTSRGVKRDVTELQDYAKGNCAHCHEQHASIDGQEPVPVNNGPSKWLAFTSQYIGQTGGFCFTCHKAVGGSKQQGMIEQHSYSYKFGGYTSLTCPASIKDAFQYISESGNPRSNCGVSTGSSHELTVIKDFLIEYMGFGPKGVNPCTGCHNPHKAQWHDYPVGAMGKSPLSLPTTYGSGWGVFGADHLDERMDRYPYQAPYYFGSVTTYEPDGNNISDGSNVPDYVNFCMECHNPTITRIVSPQRNIFTDFFLGSYLKYPDWNSARVAHGLSDGDNPDTNRKDPYKANRNYILSCLDCHEPHGSPNGLLIREEINGEDGVDFTVFREGEMINGVLEGRIKWMTLCERCHEIDNTHEEDGGACYRCHRHDPGAFRPI